MWAQLRDSAPAHHPLNSSSSSSSSSSASSSTSSSRSSLSLKIHSTRHSALLISFLFLCHHCCRITASGWNLNFNSHSQQSLSAEINSSQHHRMNPPLLISVPVGASLVQTFQHLSARQHHTQLPTQLQLQYQLIRSDAAAEEQVEEAFQSDYNANKSLHTTGWLTTSEVMRRRSLLMRRNSNRLKRDGELPVFYFFCLKLHFTRFLKAFECLVLFVMQISLFLMSGRLIQSVSVSVTQHAASHLLKPLSCLLIHDFQFIPFVQLTGCLKKSIYRLKLDFILKR